MRTSGYYKSGSNAKVIPMETILNKVYVLSQTVHQTFQLTRRLKGEVIGISPSMKKYTDLALQLDQSRFAPLLQPTLERFELVQKNKDYFESEMQEIVDANKKFLLLINKSEYKKMSMGNPKGMVEFLTKENRSATKVQMTAINLKEHWDVVKETVRFEIMDSIALAQELYTRLTGTEVEGKAEMTGGSAESDKMRTNSQSALHPSIKKLRKMNEDQASIQSSIVVFLKTLQYTGELKQQLEKEVSEITSKIEKYHELHLAVKQSRFAPILPEIETKFGFVEQKGRYFLFKLERLEAENGELMKVVESPEFKTQKYFPDPKAMLKKTIEINRSAAQLMVTVRRLNDEWEAGKEEIDYEANAYIRFMEELYNKLKKEQEK